MESNDKRPQRQAFRVLGSACILGIALGLLGTGVEAGGTPPDDDGRFGTLGDPGGEEVGTLPSVIASPSLWLPSVTFTGTQADVQSVITSIEGLDPAIGVSNLADGRTRFVLYGEVTVGLDRSRLELLDVDVSIQVGPVFAGGLSQLTWNGVRSGLQVLPTEGDVRLGLDALASAGLLDEGTAQLNLVNPRGSSASFTMVGLGDRLQIRTDHPLMTAPAEPQSAAQLAAR